MQFGNALRRQIEKNRVIRAGQAVQQRNAEQICDDGRKLFRLYVDIPVTVSVFHVGEGMHVIRAEYKERGWRWRNSLFY